MSQPTPLRIFIGYDRREDTAYRVCAASLARRARRPVAITPLIQDSLRARGLYTRPVDPLASTEFTYTRFLTPYLAGFEGGPCFAIVISSGLTMSQPYSIWPIRNTP